MDDELATQGLAGVRPEFDFAGMAGALQAFAEQMDAMTKAMGGVATIVENVAKAVKDMAQVTESIREALRGFFEGQVPALASSYVPGERLVALRRQDKVALWAAVLARLRRSENRPAPRSRIIVLTAQPNGPNRPIASNFFAIGPLAAA